MGSFEVGSNDFWVLRLDAYGSIHGCSLRNTSNAATMNGALVATYSTAIVTESTVLWPLPQSPPAIVPLRFVSNARTRREVTA